MIYANLENKLKILSKGIVSISRPLELIHMDLFGSIRTTSLGEKKYYLVIVDDFFILYGLYFWHTRIELFQPSLSFIERFQIKKVIKLFSSIYLNFKSILRD